ncbi:hypothetical protein GGX14DRAFT_401107 [Mycena pura]|uniref:Uncharacterized protein n=1 Tax=Mycena pura TaxID=153505 RepID=A0AAD6V4Q4_9AGAR|nr:hypothetical protein GGX14DRAFT_401107 [Mycena pura]
MEFPFLGQKRSGQKRQLAKNSLKIKVVELALGAGTGKTRGITGRVKRNVYRPGSDLRVNPAVPVAERVRVETLTRWGYGFHGFGCGSASSDPDADPCPTLCRAGQGLFGYIYGFARDPLVIA